MKNNKIETRSVEKLLTLKFVIPDYQRGYRWTEQQVVDLLKDIHDFMLHNSSSNNSQQFYCIQPLVVRECVTNEEGFIRKLAGIKKNVLEETRQLIDESTKWEVIDGQQRLTTIRILLSYLDQSLAYASVSNRRYVLEYSTRKESVSFLENIATQKQEDAEKNIDFFHMYTAYKTIKNWFENTPCDKQAFLNTLLNKVEFIWYESVGEDPIRVFTRLNIGKISLTNSELIKALCLNRNNFTPCVGNQNGLNQFEMACQWDEIEYTLQNDEFWLFLHDTDYVHPTRIDFIFDLICTHKELGSFDQIGSDEYRTFRYFYEYFRSPGCSINECWSKVDLYFQIFREWYNDLELYHYIGYLVTQHEDLSKLVKQYINCQDKTIFLRDIKKDIHTRVTNIDLDYQFKEDGSDKGTCKHILLFHNIQTVINRNANYSLKEKYGEGIFYKFPFHLYKKEDWDVEHINSNTTNPENDTATQKEWLVNVYCGVDKDLQDKICEYFKTKDPTENQFKEIREKVDTGKEWTAQEKNRIWNYTLLDSSTNRSYGNSIFSAKRRIIIGKDKGKLIAIPRLSARSGDFIPGKEKDAESSFVPPCTRQVFLKYYSQSLGNFNYWDLDQDAKLYADDIQYCIDKLKESNDEQQ